MAEQERSVITCIVCGTDVGPQIEEMREQLKEELLNELRQNAVETLKGEFYKSVGEETVKLGKAVAFKALLSLVGLIGLGIIAWWRGDTEALKALFSQ